MVRFPQIGLIDRGFKQLKIDPCLLTRGKLLMVVCSYDVTIVSKINKDAENLPHSSKNGTEMDTKKERMKLKKFDFTDYGSIKTFLETSVEIKSLGFHLL